MSTFPEEYKVVINSQSSFAIADANVFNLLFVLLGVRVGAILSYYDPARVSDVVAHIEASFPTLYARPYPVPTNVIICRRDNVEMCAKIDELITIERPNAKSSDDRMDILTGEILGYVTPIALQIVDGKISPEVRAKVAMRSRVSLNVIRAAGTPFEVFSQTVDGEVDPAPFEALAAEANRLVDEINRMLNYTPRNVVQRFEVAYHRPRGGTRRVRSKRRRRRTRVFINNRIFPRFLRRSTERVCRTPK